MEYNVIDAKKRSDYRRRVTRTAQHTIKPDYYSEIERLKHLAPSTSMLMQETCCGGEIYAGI